VLAALAWVAVLASGPRTRSAYEQAIEASSLEAAVASRLPSPLHRAALAFGLLFVALFAVGFIPLDGPMAAVVGGALLAALQLGCVFALAPALVDGPLWRVHKTRGARAALLLAPFIGIALVFAGRLLSAVVPATAESPIESFVASRSGYLAVAVGGVLLPVVEELFFRGLLYGLIERARGANVATALVIVAFPLLHLPQVLGAWGAFASLLLTGTTMTLLRRASGSVVPSAAAHLVHNTLVALLAFPL
jgi:membrane protease YdiL (CAAX protease family)